MEDIESPLPGAASSSYTRAIAERFHAQFAKWRSKSRSLLWIACVTLMMALSYAAFSVLIDDPQVRSFLGTGKADQQEAKPSQYERRIKEVFQRAAMPNKTLILTNLNGAWAEEGTMIDMFIESFWHGEDTRKLLQHLVIVCVDAKAYKRCRVLHPHCINIETPEVNFSREQIFLTEGYIDLVWRKIKFLKTVLQMNYSFIFTDTDVLWLRNPFPQLLSESEADVQVASDYYNGRPWDAHNSPNTGFLYVHANARTVRFFDYWYTQRIRASHMHDQDGLNLIKFDKEFTSIGTKLRFLDTQLFGGFCELKTTDLTKAITMHATCCKGLKAKLIDLRAILEGWKKWHVHNLTMSTVNTKNQDSVEASPQNDSANQLDPLPSHHVSKYEMDQHFTVPIACPQSWHKR